MKRGFLFTCLGFRFLLVVGLLVGVTTRAESVSTNFKEANKLYEQGKFSQAASGYKNIIKSGSVSAPLYFNLGNAHLKAGEIGRAIFAYRQANRISPRDPEINANLQFARNQATGGKAIQANLWKRFLGKLTLNEWTILASVFVSLWFILLAIRQWRANGKKSFPFLVPILTVFCGLLAFCLGAAVHKELYESLAIVIVPEAVVRRGPFQESQSAFTLRDGAEVTILGEQSEWIQIEEASGRTGWVPEKQLISFPNRKPESL